jgi:hypothetical protein
MSLIVTKSGDVAFIAQLVPFLDGLDVGLFVNDYLPNETTVLADLVEPTFPGYLRLSASGWGSAFLNALGQGEVDLPPLTWTSSGTNSDVIHGYFLVDAFDDVIFLERFAGVGIPMFPDPQQLSVTPKFTGISQFG